MPRACLTANGKRRQVDPKLCTLGRVSEQGMLRLLAPRQRTGGGTQAQFTVHEVILYWALSLYTVKITLSFRSRKVGRADTAFDGGVEVLIAPPCSLSLLLLVPACTHHV